MLTVELRKTGRWQWWCMYVVWEDMQFPGWTEDDVVRTVKKWDGGRWSMVGCSQKKMKYWKTANTVNIGKLSSSLCHCLAIFVLSLVSVLGFSHARSHISVQVNSSPVLILILHSVFSADLKEILPSIQMLLIVKLRTANLCWSWCETNANGVHKMCIDANRCICLPLALFSVSSH